LIQLKIREDNPLAGRLRRLLLARCSFRYTKSAYLKEKRSEKRSKISNRIC